MVETYVYRKNHKFHIDKTKLKPAAQSDEICNAMYAAIYLEFRGADKNINYRHLNYIQRFEKLNEFVEKWLKDRKLF